MPSFIVEYFNTLPSHRALTRILSSLHRKSMGDEEVRPLTPRVGGLDRPAVGVVSGPLVEARNDSDILWGQQGGSNQLNIMLGTGRGVASSRTSEGAGGECYRQLTCFDFLMHVSVSIEHCSLPGEPVKSFFFFFKYYFVSVFLRCSFQVMSTRRALHGSLFSRGRKAKVSFLCILVWRHVARIPVHNSRKRSNPIMPARRQI